MDNCPKEIGDKLYPEIKQDYNHVDACTMWFVKQPEYYDVIVTENLFGDIITDLAAIIQGGVATAHAPSAWAHRASSRSLAVPEAAVRPISFPARGEAPRRIVARVYWYHTDDARCG